jgi:hypothetical protein
MGGKRFFGPIFHQLELSSRASQRIVRVTRNKNPESALSAMKLIRGRRTMKTLTGRLVKFNSTALALLTTVLLGARGAAAKDHRVKASETQARVVAHISFTGLLDVDMAMQKRGNEKYYLYVQHSKDQGISIIDVSTPAQPKAVAVIPWPDSDVTSRMNVTGDLAIIAETGALPMRRSASDDDLVLWDLSNPPTPRVVQRFSRVVKWLQDERDFIYVLNGEGLWVVSKPAVRQPQQDQSSGY